jgi:nucleoside-diphosphate-sugar epimerase
VSANNTSELKNLFAQNAFDGVIHLASCFTQSHSDDTLDELIDTNVKFSTQLLDACCHTGVRWFINTGTFWQHYNQSDYSPVNLYSATKQAFETIAQFYIETTQINFATLKLSDTFGPNDTRPKIFALWEKQINNPDELLMSPGNQLIDISYIDNVTSAFSQLVTLVDKDKNREHCGKYYAVNSSEILTLKDLSKKFETIYNVKLAINWGARPYRNREVMTPWNSGIPVPGWKPVVSLDEGIEKMRNLYRSNPQ